MNRKRTMTLEYARSVGGTPTLVGEIEVHAPGMFGDADVDCALRSLELRPRFKEIEGGTDLWCTRGFPGCLVIASSQPRPNPIVTRA